MKVSNKLLPFYCSDCQLEFNSPKELQIHNCPRIQERNQLREANADTGASIGVSE